MTLADIDVVVMNVPWNVIPRTGINGFCYDAHQIILWLDCSHHYLQANFESTVRATLAHELHHCARSLARGTSHSSTYGGSLVAEGLACCFEEEIGENIPFYAIECTGEALQKFGDKAKQNVHKNREKLFGGWRQWVFGINNDPEFPYQCGYSTGYSLVRGWLNKTGSTASAAVGIDENEILDMWLDGQIELIGY
ncbi:MAG: DUF2268 domain-containing protein [Hyphomicrobiales bacterium]|nr:DUF2268 domain-containing protein [Hyphomicrobiales bacterium]